MALAETAGEAGRVPLQQLVDQPVVGGDRDGVRPDSGLRDRAPHHALEHRRGAAHGVVPVHVTIHLIFGEQQRFERREPLLVEGERGMPVLPGGQRQRREQPVHVDHPVGNAAHPRVAGQIVELVHVERARDQAGEGFACPALDEGQQSLRRGPQLRQPLRQLAVRQVPRRQLLVVREAGFLEGMGKGIVPDVVQQRGELQLDAVRGVEPDVARVFQLRQRATREMVCTERVLEAAMGGAGIDEERVPQLAHVAQPLEGGGVHHGQRFGIEPDVVPQRVANDLEPRQCVGPAFPTAACT